MNDYDQQLERLKRRRAIAEAMMAQSMQMAPAQGQFVDYASPIAKIAQAYFGGQQQQAVDAEEMSLGQTQRNDVAAALSEYTRATTARPAEPAGLMEDVAGIHQTDARPSFMPGPQDRRGAAAKLMSSVGGDSREVAKFIAADALKGGNEQIGKLEPKDYSPESWAAYLKSGNTGDLRAAPKVDSPRESDLAVVQRERQKLLDAGTPASDPRIVQFDDKIKKLTSHAPAPSAVATANTERGYGAHFAAEMAKRDSAMLEAASKAPDLAERANRVKEVLSTGKVITGAGADYRLAFGKALGLVGASDQDVIANTETLVSDLAQNTLDAIKGSGLGSGNGFTNSDRDFLEKAVGGKVTLEAKTIDRLADLAHRAAEKSAEKWFKRVGEIPDSALEGTGIKRERIPVPALFKPGGSGRTREEILDQYGVRR